jgi:hypothetical protein
MGLLGGCPPNVHVLTRVVKATSRGDRDPDAPNEFRREDRSDRRRLVCCEASVYTLSPDTTEFRGEW